MIGFLETRARFILGSQQSLVLIGKVLKRSLPLTAGFFSFLDNVDEEEMRGLWRSRELLEPRAMWDECIINEFCSFPGVILII